MYTTDFAYDGPYFPGPIESVISKFTCTSIETADGVLPLYHGPIINKDNASPQAFSSFSKTSRIDYVRAHPPCFSVQAEKGRVPGSRPDNVAVA